MNARQPKIIQLAEYRPVFFAPAEIPQEVGEKLLDHYKNKIDVDPPTFKTNNQWRLVSQGWVGHIPLTPAYHFALQPKIPLGNLFRMLEYAYNLNSFHWLDGLVNCHSLDEFYERLANILARQVLSRSRQGLYRSYLSQTQPLPYLRGRLDVQQALRSPGQVKLRCHYQEHTADVEENQILAWTLFTIGRSGRVLPTVRRAFRTLQGAVTLTPHGPQTCQGRTYNRLNQDYQPMHALCRFFLEHSGPAHQLGSRTTLPFLVDMAALFEQFVARWLATHLPENLSVRAQEKIDVDALGRLHFVPDLVIYNAATGAVRCVLDTKYKQPDTPSNADISQVVTYAQLKGCRQAVLIYPEPLPHPLDENIGDIRVRSATFALAGDLEQAGQAFLRQLVGASNNEG